MILLIKRLFSFNYIYTFQRSIMTLMSNLVAFLHRYAGIKTDIKSKQKDSSLLKVI